MAIDDNVLANKASDQGAQENAACVGALLCAAREAQGLAVEDVSKALRIGLQYIKAIEDSRYEDLPSLTYGIGFVRSYASFVKLDSAKIIEQYKGEATGISQKTDLSFPSPVADGGLPGAVVLGLGLIIALLAYGGWYWNLNKDETDLVRVEPVPEHLAVKTPVENQVVSPTPKPEPAPLAASAPTPAPSPKPKEIETNAKAVSEDVQEKVSETVEAEPVTKVEAVVEEASPAPVVQVPVVQAPVVPAPVVQAPIEEEILDVAHAKPLAAEEPEQTLSPATPATLPTPSGPSRITVRASVNSWIQVSDKQSNTLLFRRLLRAGDEYLVPNQTGLVLMTGNAGALEIIVDGEVVAPLGDLGEVRRDVILDAEALKSSPSTSQ